MNPSSNVKKNLDAAHPSCRLYPGTILAILLENKPKFVLVKKIMLYQNKMCRLYVIFLYKLHVVGIHI